MGDWDFPNDPLAALRDGDPGPFEGFVRSHTRAFFTYFRRLGASTHRAEDLTQDVFVKLHQHAPRYRAEERFAAFSFRVARNVWIDDNRRRSVRPRGSSLDEDAARAAAPENVVAGGPAPTRDPADAASLQELDVRTKSALRQLPDHHREVFELGFLEELSYAEVASILGIPIGTVKSRMFHAVRKLREALEGQP